MEETVAMGGLIFIPLLLLRVCMVEVEGVEHIAWVIQAEQVEAQEEGTEQGRVLEEMDKMDWEAEEEEMLEIFTTCIVTVVQVV